MKVKQMSWLAGCACVGAGAAMLTFSAGAAAQQPTNPNAAANAAATAADHQDMMEQLGIKALRPGPSGNESAPNHANYDEALANPVPEPAGSADAEERPEGHDAPTSGGSSGGPRSSRSSIAKCSDACRRTCRRSPGRVNRTENVHGRRTAGRRQGARSARSTTRRTRTSPSTSR